MLRNKLNKAAAPQNADERLWQAVNNADLSAVKETLRQGAHINARISTPEQAAAYGTMGATPLTLAANAMGKQADEVFAHLLEQENIDLYAADETGAEVGTVALSNGYDGRLLQYIAAVKTSLLNSQKAKTRTRTFTGPVYSNM